MDIPKQIDAEEEILGSLLIEENDMPLSIATEMLEPKDFYLPEHQYIYRACQLLYGKGKPVNVISVKDLLESKKYLDRAGGTFKIARLPGLVATTRNIEYNCQLVKKASLQRRLMHAAKKIAEHATGDFETTDELIGIVEQELFAATEGKIQNKLVRISDFITDHLDVIAKRKTKKGITGIPTGFEKLDSWTAGWQKGELIIIAGRPSMGKTSLALKFADVAAVENQNTVAVFMLEVSKEQALEKMIVARGEVDGQSVRTGALEDVEWSQLTDASNAINEAEIYIDDSSSLTVPEIRAKCKRIQANNGLDLVVIDYLQLLKCHKKKESRMREIEEISTGLRIMAKDLNVPVIALSQLNRACENRPNKKPQLSDLRESGNIEQEAHVVILVHRPEFYWPDKSEYWGKAELIVAKQRNGPTGTIEIEFKKRFAKFEDIGGVSRWAPRN